MKAIRVFSFGALAALGALQLAGCASSPDQRAAGQVFDDAAVTGKVKTALAREAGLGNAMDVNVTTYRGTVQLSGFVESEDLARRAATIAQKVEGVRSVKNDLRVSGSAGQSWSKASLNSLLGKSVTNAQGESLGEVKDLVLDLSEGSVRYAILEFGGRKDKLFAYPLSAFRLDKGDRLLLDVERSQLAGAEGFERGRFPPGNDPYWARAERAHGVPSASAGGGRTPGEIEPPEFVRASRVLASAVKDSASSREAQVKDLVLDLQGGRVQQLVVENNGRTVDLPMQRVSSAGGEGDLRLKADLPAR